MLEEAASREGSYCSPALSPVGVSHAGMLHLEEAMKTLELGKCWE